MYCLYVCMHLCICKERDKGIFECLQHGLVTAAVIVANGASVETAIAKVKQLGWQSRVGLHLNVSEGYPLSNPASIPDLVFETRKQGLDLQNSSKKLEANGFQLSSKEYKQSVVHYNTSFFQGSQAAGMIDKFGSYVFLGMHELKHRFDSGAVDHNQLAIELKAQLLWFLKNFGTFPTFINGHQHCHISLACTAVAQVLRDCGVKYIRSTAERPHSGITSTDLPALCERCAWVAKQSDPAMKIYKVCIVDNSI